MKTTTSTTKTEYEFSRPMWARLRRIKNSDVVVSVGTTVYSTITAELKSMNVIDKLGLPKNLVKFSDLPVYKYVKDNLEEVENFIQFDTRSMYYPKARLRRIIKRYLDEYAVATTKTNKKGIQN
jgi:hypothetical protein